jgi:hypothetical protein
MADRPRKRFHAPRHWSLSDYIEAFSIPEPNSGCHLWLGRYLQKRPYGRIGFRNREVLAHRAAWEARHGAIPEGLSVCHRCDNPACVNADHLFLGTAQDNVADMMRKGRHRPLLGEANPSSKLTKEDVVAIRASSERPSVLARKYGITASALISVRVGRIWKHVEGE